MKTVIKWIWGLDTNPDEVQTQELAVMSTKVLGVAVIVNIIILVTSLIWDIIQQQISFPTLLICIMLIIISAYSVILTRSTMGKYATNKEVTTIREYNVAIKQLEIRTFLQAIIYFCIFTLLFVFGTSYILSEKPTYMDLVGSVVAAIIFGLFMFYLNKSKIKRNY